MDSVKLIRGDKGIDDRGSVSFINDFNFSDIKRFYQVENHTVGFIRAWHAHRREGKYVYVAKGCALVGAVNLETEHVDKFVLSGEKPQVLWIPPGYANGFKNLVNGTIILFFSTSSLEESRGDDERFPFDKWNIWEEDYR